MAKKKNEAALELKEPVKEPVEVSLEEVLGALINAVNNQTAILEELAKRIPPIQKPKAVM